MKNLLGKPPFLDHDEWLYVLFPDERRCFADRLFDILEIRVNAFLTDYFDEIVFQSNEDMSEMLRDGFSLALKESK